MRTLDLTPLFRSSVGFDRMTSMLETASRMDANPANTYPPYNIERQSDDAYRITMAVAGFTLDDLEIEIQDQSLTVRGRQGEKADDDTNTHYLHRGIAGRSFQRRFDLADHMRVEKANLADGLLTIDLKRELPEEMRPRRIEIATGEALPKVETKQIETGKQAA